MNKRSVIDRTTRLAVTITFFGGIWYILLKVLSLWVNVFSEIFYVDTIISDEHILVLSMLISMLAITSVATIYIYKEYRTFKSFDNADAEQSMTLAADKAFDDIFSMMKICLVFLISVNIIATFLTEINIRNFSYSILVGIIIGLVWTLYLEKKIKKEISLRLNKESNLNPQSNPAFKEKIIMKYTFFKLLKNTLKKLKLDHNKTKPKLFLIFIYFGILIIIPTLVLMVMGLEGNKKIEISVKNDQNIPLVINLANLEKPRMEIMLINQRNKKNPIKLVIDENGFLKSGSEVLEKTNTKESFMIKESTRSKFFRSNWSTTHYYYNELEKYIQPGGNLLEIYIFDEATNTQKSVKVFTTIFKDKKKIIISQEYFELTP